MCSREFTPLLLITILCAGCKPLPSPLPSATPSMNLPRRILFVGNSFTYYNGGLENHVKLLAESVSPLRHLIADRATKGGATLKTLQGLDWVHEKIRVGRR